MFYIYIILLILTTITWLKFHVSPLFVETDIEAIRKWPQDTKFKEVKDVIVLISCLYRSIIKLWRKVWQFNKKLNISLEYNPVILLLRSYLGENEIICPHKHLHVNVHNKIIHNRKNVDTNQMSMSEWVIKMWFIHAIKYYLVKK